MGLLLPNLPEGSTYTGIDFAEDLIKKGKTLFESQKWKADFLCENLIKRQAHLSLDRRFFLRYTQPNIIS